MATNLATILVQLQTNTSNFQSKMNTAGKSVEKFGKKQSTINKTAVAGNKKLQNAFRDTAGTIAAVQGPLGPVAGRINSLGAIIGRVGIGTIALTGGFVAMGFALRKLISDTKNADQQFLRLQAILRATGHSAQLSLGDIQDLSAEIGIATLASTQKVRDAAGVLLTFKSISGETFKNALRLTQDLAEVGFGDLRTASMQLGKALEEPIVGLGALRRVGVSFTEAQKEQIRVLDMTGRKAEAQEIILRALNSQVGGAGVKAASGLNGAIDSLRENFTLFFEQTKIGRAVVDFLTVSINRLADAMGDADKNIDALNTTAQVMAEIEVIQRKIEDRAKHLDDSMADMFMVGEDSRLKELNADLEAANAKLRVLRAIEKDGIETEKKEKELYGFNNDLKKKETDLDKIRINQMKDFNRSSDRQIEDLGKTKHELRELNELRKIEDKLRSELKSQGPEAEAAIAEQMVIVRREQALRNDQVREAIDLQTQLDAIASGVGKTFASVGDKISDAMARGKLHTLDFADILKEMVVELQKMIFKVLVLDEIQRNIEERIKKTRTSGGGNIIADIFGSFFGGSKGRQVAPGDGMASGGAVSGSQPRLVGERGPELFVPRTAGSITPSSLTPGRMGGSPINISQNLNFAVGITNTVRAEVMNMLPAIQNSTLSAVAEAKQRGGKFSKAFGD